MTTDADGLSLDLILPGLDETMGLPVADPLVEVDAIEEPSMRHFELVVVIASFAVVVLLGLIK